MLLLTVSCNPLKRAQRAGRTDAKSVDKSEIQKIGSEMLRQQSNMTQTVIEFYPPVEPPQHPAPDDEKQKPSKDEVMPEPLVIKPPPVRRIVRTEVSTNTDKQTTTDSTAHRNIDTVIRNELADEVVEKPPSSVIAIRWIVAGLALVMVIIILLKFRRK